MTSIAEDLARFIIETPGGSLSAEALERAKMCVASTLASAATGSAIGSASIIRDIEHERGGAEQASVWFSSGPKLPLAGATRVNSVMSDAAASDDSDMRNIAHIGTNLTSVSLAVAEHAGASGAEVLEAIVLGYEVAGRIGEVLTPGYAQRRFHATVITVFGGITAASRLLRLTVAQTANALCLAATSIGGVTVSTNSEAREYQAGLSAMLGINAVLAAAKGYVVDTGSLEARGGYFDVFGGAQLERLTAGLGESWDIVTDLAFKLAPGAHQIHTFAEAAAELATEHDLHEADVEAIVARGSQVALFDVRHPNDLPGMAHSLPYFVAAAFIDRDFTWVHASSAKLADPVIASLQDRVQIEAVSADESGGWEATVEVRTRDGRILSRRLATPRGASRQITWEAISGKYRTLFANASWSDSAIESSLSLIRSFDSQPGPAELLRLLVVHTRMQSH